MATILFDLDGTLIDTSPLVIPAFRSAVRTFSRRPEPTEAEIVSTFGMPDEDIWRALLPDAAPEVQAQA
ncbi:MAG: HAD hydrolase-like protein [Alicyclobacillus sp.]|nr:HAD hydrolase-like protein [Alicyclobacillus sp.]